jgi:hypothetical protein
LSSLIRLTITSIGRVIKPKAQHGVYLWLLGGHERLVIVSTYYFTVEGLARFLHMVEKKC